MGFCTTFMVVALLLMTMTRADVWPGQARYNAICLEIIRDADANSIPFRKLVRSCYSLWGWHCYNRLKVDEYLTRHSLCKRLVKQHNIYNSAFLATLPFSDSECMAAFSSPAQYGIAQWNNWAGRHCGTWKDYTESDAGSGSGAFGTGSGTGAFDNEAYWNTAVPSSHVWYHRQSITFDREGTCCDSGWNESGGSQVVVWGWDPKDDTNHFGYQGCLVGWPFTSASGADCIVWLTGEEGFLECIKTVGSTKRRTSAGFWGFGWWIVQTSNTQFCEPLRN